MGPFGYFRRRRERESAPSAGDDSLWFDDEGLERARSEAFEPLANDEAEAPHLTPGQQHDVVQLFQMVGAALRTGQVQIEETKTMPGARDDRDGEPHSS